MRERLDEFPVEQKLRDRIDANKEGIANDASVIENFLGIWRSVDHDVKHGEYAIQCRDGHGQKEQNEQKGEQASNHSILVRVDGVLSTSCCSPFVDEQHVPGRTHDATIGEDGGGHES